MLWKSELILVAADVVFPVSLKSGTFDPQSVIDRDTT